MVPSVLVTVALGPTVLQALTTLSDSTATTRRTITFSSLDGTGCSTLRGKFKVTKLTAVSWHGTANLDSTTLSTAFFYIGAAASASLTWACC